MPASFSEFGVITRFSASDLDHIGHLQPEGWTDIVPAFGFYLKKIFCHPFIMRHGGQNTGLGCAIFFGDTGWLAHIIVSPEYRGTGLGTQMTSHLMKELGALGVKRQLLIATDLGEPIYRKLGFKTTQAYLFFEKQKDKSVNATEGVRSMTPDDIAHVVELDRLATGEDRRQLLHSFFDHGWVHVSQENNEVDGFFLPLLGEGLIIAKSDRAGRQLLKQKMTVMGGKTVLPEDNDAGIALLEEGGYRMVQSAARMVYLGGDPLASKMLFSRIGGNLG